jgi:hypothetical protein
MYKLGKLVGTSKPRMARTVQIWRVCSDRAFEAYNLEVTPIVITAEIIIGRAIFEDFDRQLISLIISSYLNVLIVSGEDSSFKAEMR